MTKKICSRLRRMWWVLVLCGPPAFAAGPLAFETVPVQVADSMRHPPFNRERQLRVPSGFEVQVVARIPKARFLMGTPKGDLLVSLPAYGKIMLLRLAPDQGDAVQVLINGLRHPQGMAFTTLNGATYLYVGESNQICRFRFDPETQTVAAKEPVVTGLPDSSTPELGGAYGHELKNLTVGPDHKLYVDIASSTNAGPADASSDPVRCAVYQYDLDGTHGRLFARGIRNAEGLAFLPGTNQLWAVVNGRDNLRYPLHQSWQNGGTNDYGKRLVSYIDDHPPDALIHVREGANFGWPFANPNPDTPSGLNNMPFDPDYENNPDWQKVPEADLTRIDKGIQAHSAPLGMAFLQGTNVPEVIRHGLAVAYHGSWDRSRKTGYKVTYFPWTQEGHPGAQVDLVTGWLDESTEDYWGRPVDVKPGKDGALYISDDDSGTVYKVARKP